MNKKNLIIGVIALIVLVGAYMYFTREKSLGGTTNFNTVAVDAIQVGGSTATTFSGLIGTTCNLIASDASQAASTTKAYSCAVTGLTSSYSVIAQLASSTPAVAGGVASGVGWFIVAAKASTTAGFAEILLANMTGASAIPSVTSVGSSTAILGFK